MRQGARERSLTGEYALRVAKLEERSSKTATAAQESAALEDYFEAGEFMRIDFVGGYGSVFGGEARVRGDFFQRCVKELLGRWVRVEEPTTA